MGVEIKNITKYYGKKRALHNVSVKLGKGIYGLLGANGAGKTTLINIMVTALAPTEGSVLYNGKDIRSQSSGYLDAIGYMPQSPKFYKNYTAEQFLRYMAALKDVRHGLDRRIRELLEFVNLSGDAETKLGAFSGGMLQRMGIAQALINDPEILILDEPTAGLDPKERIRLRNLISSLAGERTVIFATHIVPDIEYIANSVLLLHEGELLRNDTPKRLCDEIRGSVWLLTTEDGVEDIITRYRISNIHRDSRRYYLRIVSDKKPHPCAVSAAPTLEDVFLYHSGGGGS